MEEGDVKMEQQQSNGDMNNGNGMDMGNSQINQTSKEHCSANFESKFKK